MKVIKPKKRKIVNEKTLIVTADIGKVTNMGYCRCPDGSEVEPFKFKNNRRGFDVLWEQAKEMKKEHELEKIIVGIESTGGYGEPFLHYLNRRDVTIVQVNPMHTKKVKELQGNSPLKTDKKDPKVIADIIELGHAISVVIPEDTAAELRRLSHAREREMQAKIALNNQLQSLIFTIFPEFLVVMKDINTASSRCILSKFPAPGDIVKAGVDKLTVEINKASRGKLGRQRAQELYNAAVESVGVVHGQRSIILEINWRLHCIENSEGFIKLIEKDMANYLAQIPYSQYILSLKGIGVVTTAGLIGEIGEFSKFKTISEVIKLCGLDLYEISSGNHKGSRRISKRGRPLLRKLLFYAALNTVKKNGVMHKQYQKHLEKGMPRLKALTAIARKLIMVIYALVRDHQKYIENYSDTQNRLKEAA